MFRQIGSFHREAFEFGKAIEAYRDGEMVSRNSESWHCFCILCNNATFMTDKNPNDTADVTHFTDCGELTRGQVILTLIETGGQNVNDLVGIPGSPREVDQFCHRALMGIVWYSSIMYRG